MFAVCLIVLIFFSLAYLPFYPDDGFISLRYARRLASGNGLTWTDGERVEGYSDFLWVVIMGIVGVFTDNLIDASRIAGLVCMAGAIGSILYAHRPSRVAAALPSLIGGLFMVLTSEVQAWAIGGLEPALLTGLVAASTVCAYPLVDSPRPSQRRASILGVLLGLTALTRPDGVLFTASTLVGILLARRDATSFRIALRAAAISAGFVLAQMSFRLLYYRAWIPNTAHSKLSFNKDRITQGWSYVSGAEPYLHPLVVGFVICAVVALTQKEQRRRLAVPIMSLVAWTGYVCLIGGDIFPARRHLVVSVALAAMVIALGAECVLRAGRAARTAAWIAAPLALYDLASAQKVDPERQHALNDTWQWTGRPVGKFLTRAFGGIRPLLAVDSAGALPYFASELPCVDMLGLNDRYIAEHPPPGFGHGFLGHELGDGKYLLGRKPDIVAFWTPVGGDAAPWRGGREMKETPEFAAFYQGVTFQTSPPEIISTRLWVRREDGRIGVMRRSSQVTVPGFLFASSKDSFAGFDGTSHLGAIVDADHSGLFTRLALAAGGWKVHVDASGPCSVQVLAEDNKRQLNAEDESAFELANDSDVDLRVGLRGLSTTAYLYRVIIDR